MSVTLITTEPLVADSCGAGRYRGGLGIQRSYRVLADDALLQLRADRLKFAPYGLEGGLPASLAQNLLTRDGKTEKLGGENCNDAAARRPGDPCAGGWWWLW